MEHHFLTMISLRIVYQTLGHREPGRKAQLAEAALKFAGAKQVAVFLVQRVMGTVIGEGVLEYWIITCARSRGTLLHVGNANT